MGPYEYEVTKIDGEYATITRTDSPDRETMLIALALLPFGTDLGTKLRWENFEYTIL